MKKLFTVHDGKSGGYLDPFCADTNGVAVRMFTDIVADPRSVFNKHPEDFVLFELGTFDPHAGRVEMLAAPVALVNGVDVRAKVHPPVDLEAEGQLELETAIAKVAEHEERRANGS